MQILGIETSCDETGIALYDDNANQFIFESLLLAIWLSISTDNGIIKENITIKKEAIPVRYNDLNSSNLKFILEKGFLFITMPCFDKILFNSLNFFKSKFFFDKPENKSFFILPQLPSLQEHNDIGDFEHLF